MADSQRDGIDALVSLAVGAKPQDIPEPVLAHQRARMLDNLGAAVAGMGAAGVAQAREYATRHAQGEGGRLFGGGRVSLPGAAFANAVAARALDFCDVIAPGYHPSSTDVPVALAVGEYTGASGPDILTALAIGQDLASRINAACSHGIRTYNGFDSNVLAYFSGAAVAAKLLGLNEVQFRDAMGHALNQAAGSFQSNQDKALAVRFIQGATARGAVDAALLAQAGISGPRRVLDGECGFFALYPGRVLRRQALTDGLGDVFLGAEETIFKLYPSCGVTLSLTEAAFDLRDRLGEAVDECERIEVVLSPSTMFICGQPFEVGETPEVNAMFSADYVVVNALRNGSSTLAHFAADAIRCLAQDPLFGTVSTREEPSYSHHDCRLIAHMPDGVVETQSSTAAGFPATPATPRQLLEKFHDCFATTTVGWLRERAEPVARTVAQIGVAESVESLMDLLCEM